MEKTWLYETKHGALLGQKITPLDSAGIYVPGGKAAYFSSVLMNALPAVAAGVKDISMLSPAVNGKINSAVLAAADICGIKDIYISKNDNIPYSEGYISKEEMDKYIKEFNMKMNPNPNFKLNR